jgi:hypothetical protein
MSLLRVDTTEDDSIPATIPKLIVTLQLGSSITSRAWQKWLLNHGNISRIGTRYVFVSKYHLTGHNSAKQTIFKAQKVLESQTYQKRKVDFP